MHRPEIDGLRAVAVLAVALYHAGLYFSGGYVGVDVFFVISGYLITSLIWKDLESGIFTFRHFWERRARRIVPAMTVVAIAVLIIGWVILFPPDYKSLGRATASQSVFAANFNYWKEAGYFAGDAVEKPLLHTWSLAVEEQFYLFMPFLAWGAFRLRATRTREGVIVLLSSILVLSFASSVYGVSKHPTPTFYLLPTRAWELLMGSVLTFIPPASKYFHSKSLREITALVGLAVIIAAIFVFSPETKFPGAAAMLPCAGAWLFIWANGRMADSEDLTRVGKFLSWRPIVFIGLVSYSFYLWHWPLLVFLRYLSIGPPSVIEKTATLAIAFACAVASWQLVERPFREKRVAKGNRIFIFAGIGLLMLFMGGIAVYSQSGFPQRFSADVIGYTRAKDDMSFRVELSMNDVERDALTPIGASFGKPSWLVWGDSHAMAMMPAFDMVLKDHGMAGVGATHSSTAPLLSWYQISKYGMNEQSPAFNNVVLGDASARGILNIVLIGYWGEYSSYAKRESTYQDYCDALLVTVKQIKARGMTPWLMLDVPIQKLDVPRALSRAAITNKNLRPLLTMPASKSDNDGFSDEFLSSIRRVGAKIVNPKEIFLDPTGQYYEIEKDGIALYCDNQHLTTTGAKNLVAPFLEHALGFE